MSWRRPPIASAAQPAGREAEPLADLDGAQRDAARVLLGVVVLLREPSGQRAHLGAEEGLLLRDELRRGEVAEQRPRLRRRGGGRARRGRRR